MMDGRQWVRLGLVLGVLSLLNSPAPAAETEDGARLFQAHWSASVFSYQVSGSLCWVLGADGALRLELLQREPSGHETTPDCPGPPDSGSELGVLLRRAGRGWTLIATEDGQGTLNAWGREWRMVPGGLSLLAGTAIRELESGRAGPSFQESGKLNAGPLFRRRSEGNAALPKSREIVLAAVDSARERPSDQQEFRKLMSARGRGLGGAGELVTLAWMADSGAESCLRITSSRRPGSLRVGPTRSFDVRSPAAEVYLPLWPLIDLLEFPGTHPAPEG